MSLGGEQIGGEIMLVAGITNLIAGISLILLGYSDKHREPTYTVARCGCVLFIVGTSLLMGSAIK